MLSIHGAKTGNPGNFTNAQCSRVVSLYKNEGMSQQLISKRMGVSTTVIRMILTQYENGKTFGAGQSTTTQQLR